MENTAIIPLKEYDFFGPTPMQNMVEGTTLTKHQPMAQIEQSQIIEYVVSTGPKQFILPNDMYLYVQLQFKLKKATAITVADWKKICPVNYLLGSLFKSVDIQIGEKQVTLAPQTYAYRSYFDSLINLGKNAHDTWLTCGLFDNTEITTLASKRNSVNEKRSTLIRPTDVSNTSDGKTIELFGKLHLDLAQQDKAILNGCTLKIRLIPNATEFFIINTATDVTVSTSFKECSLFVNRAECSQDVVVAQQQALLQTPAKYPISRCEVKPFTVAKSSREAFIDNVVVGKLPRKIYIACVDNEAFNGSFTKNPYFFEHMDIKFLCCYINGTAFPSIPYTPSFGANLSVREYFEFMRTAGQINPDTTLPITKFNYGEGNTIFGFNFAPDQSHGSTQSGYINNAMIGSLRLEIRFENPIEKAITILVYCEYDNEVTINSDRNAQTDYN